MLSLFNFSSIFPGGQLTPFAPMCGRPRRLLSFRSLHTRPEQLDSYTLHRVEWTAGEIARDGVFEKNPGQNRICRAEGIEEGSGPASE